MTGRRSPRVDPGGSGAGWSEDTVAPSARPFDRGGDGEAHPFRVDADGRYRELELVGRGGMGQVVVARDRRLGRDVALKRIAASADAPGLAARLAREARVTAVLEHPSIVPVYDAGVGPDGRLYYTMRLIHGRSLAEALAEAARPYERQRLLRPFLAVCEAVAYAHSVGVVHRDLKPANLMVGGFGETQVVDWGLAAFTASAAPELRAEPVRTGDTDGAIGTPGYMSPEQARGEPADPRADVWSLGVILHELITGERQPPPPAPTLPLRRFARVDVTPPPGRASALPPELRAIVAKATAADLGARYPDAGAMAAEVARFLDGRRVEAHAYSTLELVRRLVRRLRVPIALVLTALLVTAISVAISFRRISRERTRARSAEAGALAALVEGRHRTAWALTRQAMGELERGAVAEAGVLAAHALEADDSADARGVAAAALASPHPRHAETIDLPGCVRVAPAAWDVALCHDDTGIELWQLRPTLRRWRTELIAYDVSLARPVGGPARVLALDGAKHLVVLDVRDGAVVDRRPLAVSSGVADHLEISYDGEHAAATDGRVVNVMDLGGTAASVNELVCAGSGVVALGPGPTGFVLACADGRTWFDDRATGAWRVGPTIPDAAAMRPFAVAWSPDGRNLAVGGLSGQVVHVDLTTGAIAHAFEVPDGAISSLAFVPGSGPRLLVGSERSGATLVDLAGRSAILRLPDGSGRKFRVTPEGVVAGGRQAGRWQIDDQLQPRALRAPAGLSSVAVTADRRWIAGSRGDGRVSVWDGRSGALVTEIALGSGVVKAVAFSPAGDRLAISNDGPLNAPSLVDVGTWTVHPLEGAHDPVRRVAYHADGTLIGARYGQPPVAWDRGGPRRVLVAPEIVDLTTTPDRALVVMLAIDGSVLAFDGDQPRPLLQAPGASVVAAWAGGTAVATSHLGTVQLHRGGGVVRKLAAASRVLDLAVSPDERYLLAAHADGTVTVWRLADAARVAVLRGHTQRVAHLAFTPDGLVRGAGWDGAILTWDLRALDATPAALIAELEASWGIALPLTPAPAR